MCSLSCFFGFCVEFARGLLFFLFKLLLSGVLSFMEAVKFEGKSGVLGGDTLPANIASPSPSTAEWNSSLKR